MFGFPNCLLTISANLSSCLNICSEPNTEQALRLQRGKKQRGCEVVRPLECGEWVIGYGGASAEGLKMNWRNPGRFPIRTGQVSPSWEGDEKKMPFWSTPRHEKSRNFVVVWVRNGLHTIRRLSTWFPAGGTIWGSYRDVRLCWKKCVTGVRL